MKIRQKISILILSVVVAVFSTAHALTPVKRPLGEVCFSVGGIYPQGEFVTFSDPGPGFNVSSNIHPRTLRAASVRFEIGGNFFKSESNPVAVNFDNVVRLAEKNVAQTAWTIHTGLQLGSGTQRGFFRPRVSFSPGLYIFNIHTSYRLDDEADPFYSEDKTQARFGWRAGFGTSLFFKTGWGISFDFLYDHVYSLHQTTTQDELGRFIATSHAAKFHSYMVGFVVPLNKL